ncbi:dipeptidyl peptidase III [Cordyceps fumosorosea ARSEF 2679]|uniref:Dipeptidyl peptidase III n=1 Tax=Cordyceps fumosorosea (strain ARSEF 2679) TaxID=1081104 RepID=A0A168B720_CORFA|nr:dipeptidyl peptidase III [Cordyceps fumosorosea ARSEF 2679]OAA69711.1 dipeptidyl peptidase III [Cordyceps fumosorosea ARSEF 2679]
MDKNSIEPENTRLTKTVEGSAPILHILQASAETSSATTELPGGDHGLTVRVAPGDHAAELFKVCASLQEAAKYTSNDTQVKILSEYVESFTTGSIDAYRKSQKTWATDLSPRVESIFGFVEPDIRETCGLEDEASIPDFIYYVYLTIGTKGIDALASFNAEDQSWGDQHARGSFAILRHLLEDGGCTIAVDHSEGNLHVRVDCSKILSHGKPSLGRLLLRLHVWRCAADSEACREFYGRLSAVDGPFEAWRQAAIAAWSNESSSLVQLEPGSKIVQPNTILEGDGRVVLKLYDASDEDIIQ